MQAENAFIDEIVRRVLKELGTPAPPLAEPTEATIGGAVITRDLLVEHAVQPPRVRVAPRAILTPSARDYLRERGIEVTRESPAAGANIAPARCQVIVTKTGPQVAAALEGLRSVGMALEQRLLGSAQEVAGEGTSALCRAEADLVVALTDEPELVACLANRNGAVRAASVRDAAALPAIRRSMKPNLISLDPTGKSRFELQQVLRAIIAT